MKALLILLVASTAHADVVSVPLFALSSRGVAVEGEHPIAPQFSVGLAVGVRDPASDDFGGYAFGIGPSLRAWRKSSQRGLHGVLRLESNIVHLERAGKSLGTAVGFDPSVGIGYRFIVRNQVAITPDLGYGADIDFGHRSIPTQRRWVLVYGLSIGGRW